MIDEYLDTLFFRIFQFPIGCFEKRAGLAGHYFDVLGSKSQGASATVHRRIPDSDYQDPLADAIDMAKSDGLQPLDADMDAAA
jgi:hypothetical protein